MDASDGAIVLEKLGHDRRCVPGALRNWFFGNLSLRFLARRLPVVAVTEEVCATDDDGWRRAMTFGGTPRSATCQNSRAQRAWRASEVVEPNLFRAANNREFWNYESLIRSGAQNQRQGVSSQHSLRQPTTDDRLRISSIRPHRTASSPAIVDSARYVHGSMPFSMNSVCPSANANTPPLGCSLAKAPFCCPSR